MDSKKVGERLLYAGSRVRGFALFEDFGALSFAVVTLGTTRSQGIREMAKSGSSSDLLEVWTWNLQLYVFYIPDSFYSIFQSPYSTFEPNND